MRYILIDRIHEIKANQSIRAVKNVALSEDIFTDHFLGYPVMPGALLIESLAQAGTALLEVSARFTRKALLVMVQQAKFRSAVRPGDQLAVEMTIRSRGETDARLDGFIRVRDRLAAEAELTFSLQSPEKYYTPKTRPLVEALYAVWLEDARISGLDGAGHEEEERSA